MAEALSESEFLTLPRWVMVAYAAWCARAVLEIYHFHGRVSHAALHQGYLRHKRAVQRAIEYAELAAASAGHYLLSEATALVTREADEAWGITFSGNYTKYLSSTPVAHSPKHAAHAAMLAVQAATAPTREECARHAVQAVEEARSAVSCYWGYPTSYVDDWSDERAMAWVEDKFFTPWGYVLRQLAERARQEQWTDRTAVSVRSLGLP